LFDIGGLHYDLEETLGKRIDLVITKNMKPTFYDLIKDEEVLVYAKV
jgi:predicted nucleotidyltransferase